MMKLNKSIIGMIHLSGNNSVDRALEEIKIYEEEGLHGIIIENYHGTTDDIIETLQCVDTKMKVGINILPNNYDEAFINASFYKADFIQLDHISGTGKSTPLEKIISFKEILKGFPLIIGAGLNTENVSEQMLYADGAIVGSAFKPNGDTTKFVDSRLVNKFMKKLI